MSAQRRNWARQMIERAPKPLPKYGAVAWLTLTDDNPAKVAACVAAAECWAYGADVLEDDLRREVDAAQVAFKAGEDAAYRQQSTAHRAVYGNPSTRGFTNRRAAQLAASQPQPGDYTGGPVMWDDKEPA